MTYKDKEWAEEQHILLEYKRLCIKTKTGRERLIESAKSEGVTESRQKA